LRNEETRRCPVCHENLRRRPAIVVGGHRVGDWWRRTPWEQHTQDEVDDHFAQKPLPGRR
jgi:hypothetical protein